MEDWFESLSGLNPVWYWGIGLLVGFPLSILILNEIGYFVTQRDEKLGNPVRALKSFILPLVALVILLVQIFGFDRDALSINFIETLIGVLAINAGLSFVTRYFFRRSKGKSGGSVPQLFLDIFRAFLVLLGSAIVLSVVWGVELGGLVTALGLGSFVLGLALQDTLGNLFSGIALVYEKPFEVGDYIEVADHRGQVVEMNWRAVHILTRAKELIVIPHLTVGQGAIRNYSKPTKVYIIKKLVGFSYSDPPNAVKAALLETCVNTPGILENPAPEVKTDSYGDSAIVYEVEFAIETFRFHEEVTDDFMTRIWYTAQRYNLTIPFPQVTLHQAEKVVSPQESRKTELTHTLQNLPQFLPSQKTTESMVENSQILYFGKDEVIVRQGDPTGSIFVVVEGEVHLLVRGRYGQDTLVNTISSGDFFGEVALFSSRTSSMTAQAATDIKVVRLKPDEVRNMVSNNHKLAFQLDEVMDSRRKSLEKQLKK